ncbi:CehA/McbA family metallohydrolase [Dyadobacter crusticola]|uniref:CehA/McbA family metallohydrolase n=1 Tax=Dyadobacter crusticola TaxID=292407 RepID=UPI0004E21810|nr:CehA/McbA family metallohydrolase [Dyadobacter crusticola]
MHIKHTSLLAFLLLFGRQSSAQQTIVDQGLYHLRAGTEREWDSFTGTPQKQLSITFNARQYPSPATLSLRQEDVKAPWVVHLNGQELGMLDQDENARVRYLAVPSNALKEKGNVLTIQSKDLGGKTDLLPDDIVVGDIRVIDSTPDQLIEEAQVNVRILEKGPGSLVPARITITTLQKALQPIGVAPGQQQLAVRVGCVYTSDGKASFTLPEGKYRLYASRGFEYGVDSVLLEVKKGQVSDQQFSIQREVPTKGWVASDTHIHTFTNSGHGDATIQERLVTLAGEGIELPVFTDHNMVYNAKPMIKEMGLNALFTPVTGNEFTTQVGHFNVFPLADGAKPADYHVKNWKAVSEELADHKQVVILNHARNIFYNFQPFGPYRHISVAGQGLDGWQLPANAMEVMNSSAQQKDIMQLYMDWFGLLNRGHFLSPVGSSDSHDVMRYLVGQGRTYIQCEDEKPGEINVDKAMDQLLAGRVMVSFGLMAEIHVNDTYGAGEIVPLTGQDAKVSVRVLGPSWIKADRISLYANGKKIREARITGDGKKGVKWEGSWTVPVKSQDTYFVAIAEGPDPLRPFWIIPKPFSRLSSVWNPQVIGSSGAVWVDADKDAKRTSAFSYAQQLVARAGTDVKQLVSQLNAFDEAVAVQTASILQEQNKLAEVVASPHFKGASKPVKTGFDLFFTSLQESEKIRKSE